MATREGYSILSPTSGEVTLGLSADMALYEGMLWPPSHGSDVSNLRADGPRAANTPLVSHGLDRAGFRPLTYMDDFYYRIHVQPMRLDVGNLVTSQLRYVMVWNAWPDATQSMVAADIVNGGGIVVVSPAPLPLTFKTLQERTFEVHLETTGPGTIDAGLVFRFTGLDDITVEIVGQRLQPWTVVADWGGDVRESLAWLTEIQQAVDGSEDGERKREAPRRGWEFDLVADRSERRWIENAVWDWGSNAWALPVYPDIEFLAQVLPQGAGAIPLDTEYLDYHAGGLVMLWASVSQYELCEIDTVLPSELVLARPTVAAWPVGTRVYPCRPARLLEAPQWRRKNDRVILGRVRFEGTTPSDWPAVAPAPTYLGFPVLEWRGDEGEDPTASSPRMTELIDGDIGLVAVDDFSGRVWAAQSHAFELHGRPQRSVHRSLLYWLAGRYQRVWLPTWTDDIELIDPVVGGSETWVVARAGISAHLRQQPGRRHVRVELNNGTIYYRRVVASSELDSQREILAVNAALGVDVTPGQVRVISWMALSRQASDRSEISHVNDSHGAARSNSVFVAIGANEP